MQNEIEKSLLLCLRIYPGSSLIDLPADYLEIMCEAMEWFSES
jgi:hypothetical protein